MGTKLRTFRWKVLMNEQRLDDPRCPTYFQPGVLDASLPIKGNQAQPDSLR